ncbi:MAG: hypothetical protein NVS4B7_17720 [Ktedonobacteraceae bacterium]
MDSVPLPKRDTLSIEPETPTTKLIEAGFLSIRQGRDAEGLAFFSLARERLSAEQARFAVALEAFIQSRRAYSKAHEELLQASRLFASVDAEQQAQLAALEALSQHIISKSNDPAPVINGLPQNVSDNRLLHVLRPPSEDFMPTQLPQRTTQDRKSHSLPLSPVGENTTLPALYVTCFGHFEAKRQGKPIDLCSNRHGQTIFRYLIAQPEHRATSDTLMTLLWPDNESEVSQSRLHTAICALRRSLNHGYSYEPGRGYIICDNRTYFLDPAISIQTDVEQFLHNNQEGRQSSNERIVLYEKACLLYRGPFLLEDKYADWSSLQREHLSRLYIDMCRVLTSHYLHMKKYEDAEKWAIALLKENRCDELAHQQLIQIYAAQGRRSEAWQQYRQCERILQEELALQPLPETRQIIQILIKNNASSNSADEAKN